MAAAAVSPTESTHAVARCTAARALNARMRELSEKRGLIGTTLAIFIPGNPEKKQPCVKHVGGVWTMKESEAWLDTQGTRRPYKLAMVLHGLCALDFDAHDIYDAWVAEFPELATAPACRTKRGVHVYFERCPAVEAAGLTDGPLHNPTVGGKANIDLKTRTNSRHDQNGPYTGGFIVCAPTENYVWLEGQSLLEKDVCPMSALLLQKVTAYRKAAKKPEKRPAQEATGGKKKKARTGGARDDAATGGDETEFKVHLELAPESQFKELLRLFQFSTKQYTTKLCQMRTNVGELHSYKKVEQFNARSPGVCQICGKQQHTDSIKGTVQLKGQGGSEYQLLLHHFRPKDHPKCRKIMYISDAAREGHVQRFQQRKRLVPEEAARVVSICKQAGRDYASSDPSVWRVDDPAPGFEAHAVLLSDGKWRLVLWHRDSTEVVWWRTTLYPGLCYEFLYDNLWSAARSAGWQTKLQDEALLPSWTPYLKV